MNRLLLNRWIFLSLRLLIGGVFVYAGITKIQQPLNFADSIVTFQMLPVQLINIFAMALPRSRLLWG